MHGPHALESTTPPTASKSPLMPSRSMVALMSSDLHVSAFVLHKRITYPGVIMNGVTETSPLALACRAIEATRAMSS